MSRATPLHCALQRGDSDADIVTLLEKREDCIDARSRLGMTVLHRAVNLGRSTIVDELLNHGAQINAGSEEFSKKGYTALHYAASKENEVIVTSLLSKGAEINKTDISEKTPLHVATELRCPKIVKLLLENGANVDVRDKNGKSVLHVAVEKAHLPTVEIILDFRPDVNSDANRSSLHAAVKSPTGPGPIMQKIVEALLHYGFTVRAEDAKDAILLHKSVKHGHVKVVEALLKFGADPNTLHTEYYPAVTLLISAVKHRQFEITKLLLSHGANANVRMRDEPTALHWASELGLIDFVKLLVEGEADFEAKAIIEITPLHVAAIYGLWEVVQILLKLGASIEAKDKHGRTALHFASIFGRPEVTEVLLSHGADINITCMKSMTPLDYATLRTCIYRTPFGLRCRDPSDYCSFFFDSGNRFDCKFRFEDVMGILKQHIVSMKALEVYVSEKNLRAIDLDRDCRYMLECCQTEITNMRNKKIGDSNVSFYDVVTRSVNRLAVYARNESIVQALKSQDYNREFGFYSNMIQRRFDQGQKREGLQSSSLKTLTVLSGYALPDLFAIELLNYLSNRDLENFIKASNLQNPREKNINFTRCAKSQRVKGNKKQKTDS